MLQIPFPGAQVLSIIGVYLPSTDHSITEYTEYLTELESIVSALQSEGPIVIVGDFNAHIGALGGVRSQDSPNQAGKLVLFDTISTCNLYVASLTDETLGANYTSPITQLLLIALWTITLLTLSCPVPFYLLVS